jgi:hypothetical protein
MRRARAFALRNQFSTLQPDQETCKAVLDVTQGARAPYFINNVDAQFLAYLHQIRFHFIVGGPMFACFVLVLLHFGTKCQPSSLLRDL